MQFTTNLPAAEAHKLVPLRDHPRPAVVESSAARPAAAEPSVAPRPSTVPIRARPRGVRQAGHAQA